MFHSTVNNEDGMTSVLSLIFRYKGCDAARLRIACDIDVNSTGYADCIVPDYIEVEETSNVSYVKDKNDVDSDTPIQIYCGNDETLSSILLLEEIEYDLELEIIDNKVSQELSFIKDCNESLILKANHFKKNNNSVLYSLYSKSYVGKGFFDISIDNIKIKIPFEIRSKKIEYLTEYPQMLSDIADFSVPLLLDSKSPLFRNYAVSYTKRETFYEDYILLDYIFNKMSINDAYSVIRYSPYSELITDINESYSGNVPYLDSSELCSLVSGKGLYKAEKGSILGRYNVDKINEVYFRDSFDNQENRLIRDLLLTLQSIIYGLSQSSFADNSDYIFNSLRSMKNDIDTYLSDDWLQDVGELSRVPFESTVLQNRHGYSELFQIYQLLGTSIEFNQEDLPGLLEGHNKKVYEVYEYWCYTRLYRCLYDMSINKPKLDLDKSKSRGVMSIRYGKSLDFDIERNNALFKVHLYYNKKFDQDNERFRSYSIILRPDYTLDIEKDGFSYIINFDAKYKVKPKNSSDVEIDDSKIESGCWEYDIYKMHTYRDALMKSLGSYVLYPGQGADESNWKSYIKPRLNDIWEERYSNIVPSVGAISLTPGVKKDQQLITALNQLFDKISMLFETGDLFIDI